MGQPKEVQVDLRLASLPEAGAMGELVRDLTDRLTIVQDWNNGEGMPSRIICSTGNGNPGLTFEIDCHKASVSMHTSYPGLTFVFEETVQQLYDHPRHRLLGTNPGTLAVARSLLEAVALGYRDARLLGAEEVKDAAMGRPHGWPRLSRTLRQTDIVSKTMAGGPLKPSEGHLVRTIEPGTAFIMLRTIHPHFDSRELTITWGNEPFDHIVDGSRTIISSSTEKPVSVQTVRVEYSTQGDMPGGIIDAAFQDIPLPGKANWTVDGFYDCGLKELPIYVSTVRKNMIESLPMYMETRTDVRPPEL